MPPPMTPADARVVDPVLTNAARGYRNETHAWPYLFPVVTVGQRGGKIIEFGAEDFQELAIERAPGANRAQVNVGYSDRDYALIQRALDGKVPIELLEEATAVPGIDLGMRAVRQVMAIVSLQIELKAAKLATTAGSYAADHVSALAGAARWDNAASQPAKAVEAAKEEIAEGIGMEPNTLVLGTPVLRALKNNPDVIDRIKHTEGLSENASVTVTTGKLASYFDVDMVVAARARSGKPGAFKPIWGKSAVLAYSDVTPLASAGSPSYGYTYRLEGYPVSNPGYYDNSCDSWLYPTTTHDTPEIVGKAAGYLFRTVVD